MERFCLGVSDLEVPAVAVGCMRIADMPQKDVEALISWCLDHGLTFFDHADIYGRGRSEEVFGAALASLGIDRSELILQSKCGIVPGKRYDFSREHIVSSVDGILKRLQTEYLDVLVLHRPDALMEPDEVASAFDELRRTGKVRHFGVSNMKPSQIELLRRSVPERILCDQLQFSLTDSNMVAQGLEVNLTWPGSCDRDGSVLDWCRMNDVTIQTWSPFQHGFFEGSFIGDRANYPELNDVLDRVAKAHRITPTGVAAAWVLRHPAKMQLVTGTTKIARLEEILAGAGVRLTREEWYELYLAAGHKLP